MVMYVVASAAQMVFEGICRGIATISTCICSIQFSNVIVKGVPTGHIVRRELKNTMTTTIRT
jgi:hypothetical protein